MLGEQGWTVYGLPITDNHHRAVFVGAEHTGPRCLESGDGLICGTTVWVIANADDGNLGTDCVQEVVARAVPTSVVAHLENVCVDTVGLVCPRCARQRAWPPYGIDEST